MKRSARILVVDDEPSNIRVMERILRPEGYETASAGNGYECLDRIEAFDPDLIVLDVMMPGLDGYETTRRIRSLEKTSLTPVLLVSALQGTEDRISGIEAGCDDFISKPFDTREVLARIKTCLNQHEERQRRSRSDRADGDRARNEIWLARETQENLLPKGFPAIAGMEVWGTHAASTEVSGDYFDVIELDSSSLVIAIADVSGKGLSAALVMSNVQACLRTQILDGVTDPAILMRSLNHVVHGNTAPETFVTMWIGRYRADERRLRYARAGHEVPYVAGHEGVRTLDGGGLMLGITPDLDFQPEETALEPGETLCLYTDGVIDACDGDGVAFGHDRLVASLTAGSQHAPADLGRSILSNVHRFSGGARQTDDITLLLLGLPTHPPRDGSVPPAGQADRNQDNPDLIGVLERDS